MDTSIAIAPIAPSFIPADFHAAGRYLSKLSPSGASAMRSSLKMAARLMGVVEIDQVPWNHLDADKVERLGRLATESPTDRGPRAPATVAAMINAIKGACKSAWLAGTLSTDIWQHLREVKPPRGSRLPAGRDIGKGEKAELMRSIGDDNKAAGVRDGAIVALLMGTGMRRAELVSLALEDLDMVSGKLKIIGKGNKERTVYVAGGAMDALLDWLEVRGRGEGPLFCPIAKGGHLQMMRHMSTTALHYIIDRRVTEAGIARLTLHDFRRTVAGELLDETDLATAAAVLGHANVATTQRYDRRGERTKKAAASMVTVPYKRRARSQSRMELRP